LNELFSVLEWTQENDSEANIIARHLTKSQEDIFVSIAPEHLHREVISMNELNKLQGVQQ